MKRKGVFDLPPQAGASRRARQMLAAAQAVGGAVTSGASGGLHPLATTVTPLTAGGAGAGGAPWPPQRARATVEPTDEELRIEREMKAEDDREWEREYHGVMMRSDPVYRAEYLDATVNRIRRHEPVAEAFMQQGQSRVFREYIDWYEGASRRFTELRRQQTGAAVGVAVEDLVDQVERELGVASTTERNRLVSQHAKGFSRMYAHGIELGRRYHSPSAIYPTGRVNPDVRSISIPLSSGDGVETVTFGPIIGYMYAHVETGPFAGYWSASGPHGAHAVAIISHEWTRGPNRGQIKTYLFNQNDKQGRMMEEDGFAISPFTDRMERPMLARANRLICGLEGECAMLSGAIVQLWNAIPPEERTDTQMEFILRATIEGGSVLTIVQSLDRLRARVVRQRLVERLRDEASDLWESVYDAMPDDA